MIYTVSILTVYSLYTHAIATGGYSRRWPMFNDCLGGNHKDGSSPLARVHGCFTAESYCSVLDDVALTEAFLDEDFIF